MSGICRRVLGGKLPHSIKSKWGEPAQPPQHEGALAFVAFELEKQNLSSSVVQLATIAHICRIYRVPPALLPMKSLISLSVAFHWHPKYYANLSGEIGTARNISGINSGGGNDTGFHQTDGLFIRRPAR